MATEIPSAPTVVEWESQVFIGGISVECSWSIDRTLNGIPGKSQTESRGATGKMSNVSLTDRGIVTGRPTPWNDLAAWPPRVGTAVTIDVRSTTDSTWLRQFTGIVDTVKGGTLGVYELTITDDVDRFTNEVNLPPLMRTMPPIAEGMEPRFVNVHQNWYFETILRSANRSSTIPGLINTALTATLNGSLAVNWFGECTNGKFNKNAWASVYDSPDGWGVGMTDFSAWWSPTELGLGDISASERQTARFVWCQAIGTGATSGFTVNLNFIYFNSSGSSTTSTLQIFVSAARQVVVMDESQNVLLPATPVGALGSHLWIVRDPGTTKITLKTRSKSGEASTLGAVTTDRVKGAFDSVYINAPSGSRPGGFIASYSSVDVDCTWQPNSYIEPYYMISGMDAGRPLMGVQADTAFKSLQDATGTHVGIDEDGRVSIIPIFKRMFNTPVATLSDDTDIFDSVDWTLDAQTAVSSISAVWRKPKCQYRKLPELQVWQGSSSQITGGETNEEVIHPNEDWDWIMVDGEYGQVVGSTNYTGYRANHGYGNVFMASVPYEQKSGDTTTQKTRAATSSEYDGTISKIDDRSWVITQKAPTAQAVVTACPSDIYWLTPFLWGKATPIIRAFGTVQWVDASYTTKVENNGAAMLKIDMGDWAGDNAKMVVDAYAGFLKGGLVQWDSLEIRPNPSLRLADTIRLDSSVLEVLAQGVISGNHISFSPESGLVHKVDFLCNAHLSSASNWQEFEIDSSQKTWQAIDNAWGGSTYAAFEGAPNSK